MGIVLVAFLAAWIVTSPAATTMISTFRRTSSVASPDSRSRFPSAYRYSMAMFCLSMYPSSRRASRSPSARGESVAASVFDRYPIRETFFGCCASAMRATTRSSTTSRIDGAAVFFIAHLVSSVMYHADRDKGKCDLHGARQQVLVE